MRTTLFFIGLACCFTISLNAQSSCGEASYYSSNMNGKYTSTGETYKHDGFTCANSEFPVGTILRVTRFDDSRSVDVRVNDCIPPNSDRIVVLSGAAAARIGLLQDGVASVSLSIVAIGLGELACSKPAIEGPSSYDVIATKPLVSQPVISIEGDGTFPASAFQPIQSGHGVQVGSYKTLSNASEAASALQTKGFSKVLIRAKDGAYQVLMGPFETQSAADVYNSNLKSKYRISGFVTKI